MHFNDAYSQDLTAAAVVTVAAAVAAVVGAAVFAAVVVAAAVTIFQSISSLLLHDTKQIKSTVGTSNIATVTLHLSFLASRREKGEKGSTCFIEKVPATTIGTCSFVDHKSSFQYPYNLNKIRVI